MINQRGESRGRVRWQLGGQSGGWGSCPPKTQWGPQLGQEKEERVEAGAGVEGKCQGLLLSEGREGGIKAVSRVSGLNNWADSGSTCCYAKHREWNRSGEGEKNNGV